MQRVLNRRRLAYLQPPEDGTPLDVETFTRLAEALATGTGRVARLLHDQRAPACWAGEHFASYYGCRSSPRASCWACWSSFTVRRSSRGGSGWISWRPWPGGHRGCKRYLICGPPALEPGADSGQ
jgi:hypothetical protein